MKSADIRVLVVWEPMLPSDWGKPTRLALFRIRDSKATQFWDREHLVAREVENQLAPDQLHCCTKDGIIWDVVGLYPDNAQWGAPPSFIDGAVVYTEPEVSKRIQSKASSRGTSTDF